MYHVSVAMLYSFCLQNRSAGSYRNASVMQHVRLQVETDITRLSDIFQKITNLNVNGINQKDQYMAVE